MVSSLFQLVRRASSASIDEWQVRSKQAWFASRNCVGSACGLAALSRQGYLRSLKLTPRGLPGWWKSRRTGWIVDADCDLALQQSATCQATEIPWVLEQAALVRDGKMPLFSYAPVNFVGEDRWHRDFILRKVAPRRFYGFIPYLDAEQVGDSKHVWEPNRFSWALWLGIAYRVTADLKYAESFAELAEDWFQQNPYPIGINYCSALEVAFRN